MTKTECAYQNIDHNLSIICFLGFDSSLLFVYTVMEPLTFLFCSLTFCSLRNNKISADGVLVLAGALIVNKNLKLE